MHRYTGEGAIQWENTRPWTLSNASEFCRADNALVVTGGFRSLSIFFRRESQTAGSFELVVHTAPIYFKLLDEPIVTATAPGLMFPLTLLPTGGLVMGGTTAKMFGARIAETEPMGTVLFWEMKPSGGGGTIVGDIYVVPNYTGVADVPPISRTVELQSARLSPTVRGR